MNIATNTESYGSTPRRAMDVEDYIDILRRHKAWIVGPMFGALVLSVVVAFLWPDTYISSAIIRVVPPQVPENLVPTNVNVEMSQRINAMAQTILSRGNLTNIISTFNLYNRDRQRKPMEDVVEDMKKDIRIGSVSNVSANHNVTAFTVAFSYDNRITAQKVTSDLVSRFMSENTRDRTNTSVLTTQFLNDQLESARKELDGIEEKLQQFRTANLGRLPEQVQTNQMLLSSAENRISNINGSISRMGQEKMALETELRAAKAQLTVMQPTQEHMAAQQKNEKLVLKEHELKQAEDMLVALRERYKDTLPDVQQAITIVNRLKRERDALAKEDEVSRKQQSSQPMAKNYDPLYAREAQQVQANIDRIETQIRLKDLQIQDYSRELASAEQNARSMQGRVAAEPVSEQKYAEIVRDREVAKLKYDELNKKRSQSAISEELERRQQGETLEVLDPASLPQTPAEPKRPMWVAVGTMMGLVLGIALAIAREAKDASLKNLKDVRAYTQLTILGSVPLLENDLVVRRRKRLAWLAWSTACSVGIVIMTGSVFYYYTTKG